MSHSLFLLSAVLFWCSTLALWAFDPQLTTALPRGGQQGREVVVTLVGNRLADPEEILFYQPGIMASEFTVENAKRVKVTFTIAPDAALGEHPFRLRTRDGVSYLRTFWVTQLPLIVEPFRRNAKGKNVVESNNRFETPQDIPLNSIVDGIARNEDADYYRFAGKKGQRITVEAFGMRLGRNTFDPYIAVLDSKRFELATCDDCVLTKRDPSLSLVLPTDGNYTILLRESSYQGSDASNYLLQVSEAPRPTTVHPPVAKPGETLDVTFRGDVGGELTQKVTVPAHGSEVPLFAKGREFLSPSPNKIRLSSYPIHPEEEPNNAPRVKGQKLLKVPIPSTLHGTLSQQGDVDWFKFTAKKGQIIRAQVHARSLRSPLDSYIQIRKATDPKGNANKNNDDEGRNPDSKLDYPIPADGDYFLLIRDHLNRGGPNYTYTIDLTERPVTLSAELPYAANNNSQKDRAIAVPRGNHLAIVPNVNRQNTNCEVTLTYDQLPAGVSLTSDPAPRNPVNFPILFTAASDAPLGATLTRFQIKDTQSDLTGSFGEHIHHIEINNAGPLASTYNERLTVAVIEEAPYHLTIANPGVPLVRNGTMDLTIKAKRTRGFTQPIKVKLPWRPPGVGAPPEVTIPEGDSEIVLPINANGEAPIRAWKICVTGEANTGNGNVRLSSPLIPLTIAEPYLAGSIDLATTQAGKDVTLLCSLENLHPFPGKAELTLQGLPHQVSAKPVQISATDQQVRIPVTVPADAKPGKNKNIFAQVVISKNGQPIVHRIAQATHLIITPRPQGKQKAED